MIVIIIHKVVMVDMLMKYLDMQVKIFYYQNFVKNLELKNANIFVLKMIL